MTVIAGYQNHGMSETQHIVVVKGAPEILRDMVLFYIKNRLNFQYKFVPANYNQTYQRLAQAGARVLALGIKELGTITHQKIRDSGREEFENELEFAGFVVISCPLKADTKQMIKEIVDSSHLVNPFF